MSFFPRFREVAGSLEASFSDGLEDAPGNLRMETAGVPKGVS